MRRVVVICEGPTEEAFIRTVLYPALHGANIYLQGITVETSPGHKGGALNYARLLRALRNALANGRLAAVTTLIDLYRLASDFPGHDEAMNQPHTAARLGVLEAELHAHVVGHCGCDPARFIPYIQPHEFEALLFSDVATLIATEDGWAGAQRELTAARAGVATPEDINHGQLTKPAARLEEHLRAPRYSKVRHGPIAAEKIGLAKIEAECPHFASWLAQLRAL